MYSAKKLVKSLGIQTARQTRMHPRERKYLRMLAQAQTAYQNYERTWERRYFFDFCDQIESLHRFALSNHNRPEIYITWRYDKIRLYDQKAKIIDAFMNDIIERVKCRS